MSWIAAARISACRRRSSSVRRRLTCFSGFLSIGIASLHSKGSRRQRSFIGRDIKPDVALFLLRFLGHQLANGFENYLEPFIVFLLQFLEFSCQIFVRGQQFAKRTKARMMAILTSTARRLRKTLESMATPSCVKA